MMQKAMKSMRLVSMQSRAFSYNYSCATHPKVYFDITKDGNSAGRMVFELYSSHSPVLAANFQDFTTGNATGQRSYAGSSLTEATEGLGVNFGNLGEDNNGAQGALVADENLEMRHHKRGLLTMQNNGPNTNGSQFMITFGQTHFLNGYQNIVGEVVEGANILDQLEAASDRHGKLHGDWSISASGEHF